MKLNSRVEAFSVAFRPGVAFACGVELRHPVCRRLFADMALNHDDEWPLGESGVNG